MCSTPVIAEKLCKDCRWSKWSWFHLECHQPAIGKRAEETDPVTGKIEGGGYWSCNVNRMRSNQDCGRDGKLWEKRP
jgi:hypothetical protein